jgi:hypothetical protein
MPEFPHVITLPSLFNAAKAPLFEYTVTTPEDILLTAGMKYVGGLALELVVEFPPR